MADRLQRHGEIVFEARKAGAPKKSVAKSVRSGKASLAKGKGRSAPQEASAMRDPWETMARVDRGVEYRALPKLAAAVGLAWLDAAETLVLEVPSAVVPEEKNYVLNPAHPDFGRLEIGDAETYVLDRRLARS